MTTSTLHLRSWLVVFFACIFALVTSACGGSSPKLAAENASGQRDAALANYEEAAPEAAAPEAPPPEAPAEAAYDEAPPSEPPAQVATTVGLASPATSQPGLPGMAVAKGAPRPAPRPPAPDASAPAPGVPPETTPAVAGSAGREPLLIYMATMTLAVFETKAAIDAVEELARSRGGYLVSRHDHAITVRVPTKAFQGTLGGVSKLGDELHREVNVRDVTEQFADLEIRLKNAEAVRQRLEALLAKAAKVEDALAVERELERITQLIEQMKGRMRLLSELIAFSTITVNFQARPKDQVGSEVRLPFDWLRDLGLPPLMNLEAP